MEIGQSSVGNREKTAFGKLGRAQTPTDPAPLSMIETIITLKPKSEWRPKMTKEKLIKKMQDALEIEGVQNAFTMPIKARIDMLTTGIRTPIGIKIFGDNLEKINNIGKELESLIRQVPKTRSVYSTRELGGFFIDFIPDRETLARYGLTVMDVFEILETAVGGMDIDTTIEGRERYKINIRYPRELRNDIEKLKSVLVPIKKQFKTAYGAIKHEKNKLLSDRMEHVPLGLLGKIEATMGPAIIKNEMGQLTGWVYIDIDETDIGGYVEKAKKIVAKHIKMPSGYFLMWTGQYEYLARMKALMKFIIPIVLILIFIILLLTFNGVIQALIIMLSVPIASLGSIWLLYVLNYNTSVAVWVGIIALLGISAQTATLMLTYLEEGYFKWKNSGNLKTKDDVIKMAVEHGSSRVRPLLMAVGLNVVGLIPIMYSTGVGSDVAKRISAPLFGGLLTLTAISLFILPALYVSWRTINLPKKI